MLSCGNSPSFRTRILFFQISFHPIRTSLSSLFLRLWYLCVKSKHARMWCEWSAGSVVYVPGLPGIQAVPEDEISSPCLCIRCYKWHDSRRRSCGAILQTKGRFMLVSTEALMWVVGLSFQFISEEQVVHCTRQPSNLPLLEKITYGYVFFTRQEKGSALKCVSWLFW